MHWKYTTPPKSGKLYNEDDWNETSSIENGQAYHLSKASERFPMCQLSNLVGAQHMCTLQCWQRGKRAASRMQVLAEKRAGELAAEAGLKLVAILPNAVLGPPLSTRVDSLSVGSMKVLHQGPVGACRLTSAPSCDKKTCWIA